jgi:glycosylphosphatidylinositol transamidase (GPIT) subunit GPI8
MHEHITAPGVTAIASSIRGESSYSYQVDDELGVAVLDRFTWALLEFTKNMNSTSSTTLADLYASLDPKFLSSHPDMKQTDGVSPPMEAKVVDFMGNVRAVELNVPPLQLDGRRLEKIFLRSKFSIKTDENDFSDSWFTSMPRTYFVLSSTNGWNGHVFYTASILLFTLLCWSMWMRPRK